MRQRDKPGKTQRHKALMRNAPKAASRNQLARSKKADVARRASERDELLRQQTAMSEILGVISNSPTDLAPVFDAILSNATRLCDGNLAGLWRYDGQFLIGAAQHNLSTEFVEKYMDVKLEPGRSGPTRLAALERRTVHVADISAEPGFSPKILQFERARTVLAVPLLRKTELVGVIAIWRREVRPFNEQQIALVQTFAAQAVIAIENTRLLNELRQSLEQQTATSEVLRVISSSATDLRPVFETIAHNSANLCGATYGIVYRFDGEMIIPVAHHNLDQAAIDALHQMFPMRLNTSSFVGRTILAREVLHIADVAAEPNDTYSAIRQALGIRTYLAVPMLRDGNPIGAIALYRREVGLFSDRQIELVKL
jgi:two-component system, NtrC family, sensor kinase